MAGYKKMKNIVSHTKQYLLGLFYYIFKHRNKIPANPTDKSIFINIHKDEFRRYLSTLLYFFHHQGYSIYIQPHFPLIYQLYTDKNTAIVLQKESIYFAFPKPETNVIECSPSVNYFRDFHQKNFPISHYHIPISQHPFQYIKECWNTPCLPLSRRLKAAITIGGFYPEFYLDIEDDGIFISDSRITIYNYLKQQSLAYIPKTINDFEKNKHLHPLLVIDNAHFLVPVEILRSTLSKFNFFLALSGVVMPLCHNIIEAMSVACIPILQEEYARLFRPALQNGVNAIVFQKKEELPKIIAKLNNFTTESIVSMQQNIKNYYNNFLTPKAVIDQITSEKYTDIYLLGEHYSVWALRDFLQRKSRSE